MSHFIHRCTLLYIHVQLHTFMYTSLHLCPISCNNVSFQTFITNRIIMVHLYYTSFTIRIYSQWEHNVCLDTYRTPYVKAHISRWQSRCIYGILHMHTQKAQEGLWEGHRANERERGHDAKTPLKMVWETHEDTGPIFIYPYKLALSSEMRVSRNISTGDAPGSRT